MLLLQNQFRGIIRQGTLTVVAPDGRRYDFGAGEPLVTIRITDWAVARHVSLDPDLAVGEAYMNGTLVIDDAQLHEFLDLCLANLSTGTGNWLRGAWIFLRRLGRRFAQHNPVSVARENAAHHYDLSEALYESFLDADRHYSCAYYAAPNDTLERAQDRKQRQIAAKLLLRSGQRVLDIGSGWGSLSLYLTRVADVDVTGVTLSTEQQRYSCQ
jgi:cyclopropane-fatty-acyl-phospholipid synthase